MLAMCSLQWDEVKALVCSRLSESRYEHSLCVVERARQLARRYGADEEKAAFAGLTHDICKNMPHGEQLAYLRECGMEPSPEELCSPQIFHAMAAYCYLKRELGVQDEDVLNAVRYHTTGRAGMSLLEKVVYLADLTGADRSYPDIEQTRQIVDRSLWEGMLYSLQFIIGDLVRRGRPICRDSFEAYNEAAIQTALRKGTDA